MSRLFADYIEAYIVHSAVLAKRKFVDDDRDAVRYFRAELQKYFFAHYLGNHKLFRTVGNYVFLKKLFALGEHSFHDFYKFFYVPALSCRNGNDFRAEFRKVL